MFQYFYKPIVACPTKYQSFHDPLKYTEVKQTKFSVLAELI